MVDLISIGDATLDTFLRIHDATVLCTLKRERCFLCLSWADKIPIDRIDQTIAGNAANIAIGSARLGLRVGFYSVIGADETGKRIRAVCKQEGVSLQYLQIDKKHPTNYSVVINFHGERTILVYHYPRRYYLPEFEPVSWIYYTSVAEEYEKLEGQIVRFVRKNLPKVKLAFNPGTHQLKMGLSKMRDVLRVSQVFFVNKEEGVQLVGKAKGMRDLLAKLKKTGPQFVVVTDGDHGSYVSNGRYAFRMPVFPTKVVEKTGAGDAFAVGFLTALFYGETPMEALRWGTANASSVIQKIGPQAGLLTKAGMQRILKKYSSIVPERIA